MKLDKLFQVIVVMGSSTVALGACGGDDGDGEGDGGGGGSPSTGGATATGGSGGDAGSGTAGGGSAGAGACEDICETSSEDPDWINCGGCCCWLPVGSPHTGDVPICPEEPCCEGRGR